MARRAGALRFLPRERGLAGRQDHAEIRADVDLDEVIELLYAPLYYRKLLHTGLVTVEQVDDIIDLAFNGMAPKG